MKTPVPSQTCGNPAPNPADAPEGHCPISLVGHANERSSKLAALPKGVPGIAQSLGISALFYVFCGLALPLLFILKRFGGISLDMAWATLLMQVVAWPLTLWFGLRWSKVRFREACRLTRFPVRLVPALLMVSFGATIVLSAAANLIPISESWKSTARVLTGGNKLGLFFSLVLVAPVAEELFFRGWVLRGYAGRYSMTKAVWASAVVFAAFHLNPWQAVLALPFGLGWAWLFRRTGSLIPGMLSHAISNFSCVFLIQWLLLALGYDNQILEALDNYPAGVVPLGGAIAGLGGCILWRQLPQIPREQRA